MSAMQYSRALDCLLCEIVFADPAFGPMYMLKADVSDDIYRIGIRPEDTSKLGLIFPSGANEDPMVSIPLRFRDLHLRPCSFVTFAGYVPAASLLRSPHRFCQRSRKYRFRPFILLVRSN